VDRPRDKIHASRFVADEGDSDDKHIMLSGCSSRSCAWRAMAFVAVLAMPQRAALAPIRRVPRPQRRRLRPRPTHSHAGGNGRHAGGGGEKDADSGGALLAVGTKAPDFSLPDSNGSTVTLSAFQGKKKRGSRVLTPATKRPAAPSSSAPSATISTTSRPRASPSLASIPRAPNRTASSSRTRSTPSSFSWTRRRRCSAPTGTKGNALDYPHRLRHRQDRRHRLRPARHAGGQGHFSPRSRRSSCTGAPASGRKCRNPERTSATAGAASVPRSHRAFPLLAGGSRGEAQFSTLRLEQ